VGEKCTYPCQPSYCACPNEASAAVLAKALMARGVASVRPLEGGIAAWRARGYRIESPGRNDA
jgi:rhodanese-related sulfurtransferase